MSTASQVSLMEWIPLATPPLRQDAYVLDRVQLFKRMATIAIASFAFLAACFVAKISLPVLVVMGVCLLPAVILLADIIKGERALNDKATDEFIRLEIPSTAAFDRILKSPGALELLVKKRGNVRKVNEYGKSLIDQCKDFETFKILVDHGALADDKLKNFKKYFSLGRNELNYPDKIEYILKSRKIEPRDIPEKEISELLNSTKNAKAVELLKRYHFNIDAQDDDKITPLLVVCLRYEEFCREWGENYICSYVSALINAGANRNAAATNYDKRSCLELAAPHPRLKTLLEKH